MSPARDQLEAATDDQLARDARAGCLASFEQLARRLQVPLVRFLSRRFPSRQDSEDLAQETLLKAYQSLPAYDVGRPFRTWVFTIAYRLAVSRGRADRDADPLPHTAATTAGDDPAAIAQRRDSHQHLWHLAHQVLGPDAVTILWLYYVEDLPAGEIARVTGRSWVSVKTALHRARRRLAPYLSDNPITPAVKLGGVS